MDAASNYMGCLGESRKAYAPNIGKVSFWDSAPDELIARILAFLPCSNIYLAQGVCRKWRSIIWSPLFMLFCKEWSQPRRPWLLEFQQQMYNQAWAFDLDGWQWFHLNFFFLPENAIILASSGGLVCLGRSGKEEYQLYVCNPLTKKWRQLPSISVPPGIVLLDVDHEANTYAIVALVLRGHPGNSRPLGSVFAFNSKTGVWKETIEVPQELLYRNIWDASLCGTSLCCLTKHGRVEMFDTAEAKWTQNGRFSRLPNNRGMQSLILKRAGKWGVVFLPVNSIGESVGWYDISARRWSMAFSAKSIVCVGRYSSLCSRAAPDYGLEVYNVCVEGLEFCNSARSGSTVVLPKSPLTRQKIQGSNIAIRAFWYEPHLGVMV